MLEKCMLTSKKFPRQFIQLQMVFFRAFMKQAKQVCLLEGPPPVRQGIIEGPLTGVRHLLSKACTVQASNGGIPSCPPPTQDPASLVWLWHMWRDTNCGKCRKPARADPLPGLLHWIGHTQSILLCKL